MENKQTAVEWIESKLNSVKPTDFCSLQDVKDWVKQAKQMEKEQIMDAYESGIKDDDGYGVMLNNSEQFYNDTYVK